MRTSFYQYTLPELEELFKLHDLPPTGPRLLFHWHYKKRKHEPCIQDLAKKSIAFVQENLSFELPCFDRIQESEDKTVKFLLKLHDGLKVETVLIPFKKKYTLCLSSQVGCALKCSFCFTGTQGLARHLKTEEIIAQFLLAQKWLTENRPQDDRILNLVFMGQGEPLHNFDAVKKACEIFITHYGICLSSMRITISTAGHLPGLERWKKEMPQVNIALSLHSTIKEKRDRLIPINKKYPLEQIMPLVEAIPEGRKRFVIYEYLLVKDFNDTEWDARQTGEYLAGRNAYINLIPFNPYPGSEFQRPEAQQVLFFKSILDQYKIPTMIRTTKGEEILAACGQLNTKG